MTFTLESTFSTPRRLPTPPSTRSRPTHNRSSSASSTSSSSSSTSTSSNSGSSLRERRGVTLRLSAAGSQTLAGALSPKGNVAPGFVNGPRKRALPAPLAVFNYDAVMGKAGTKSARARDYGMGQDGWTVVLSS